MLCLLELHLSFEFHYASISKDQEYCCNDKHQMLCWESKTHIFAGSNLINMFSICEHNVLAICLQSLEDRTFIIHKPDKKKDIFQF